jgi:hypothetical protein
MDNTATSVEEFLASLEAARLHYQLTGTADERRSQLRFIGTFEDRDIIWDAVVEALGSAYAGYQHLEIAPSGYPMRRIDIGLKVDTIDTAVLLKTITMIRKYKRLRTGRHEFGKNLP